MTLDELIDKLTELREKTIGETLVEVPSSRYYDPSSWMTINSLEYYPDWKILRLKG